MRLFKGLENAFWYLGADNVFKRAIRRIRWDDVQRTEDEWVFRLGELTFTTPSLNPAECLHQWSPAVKLADGEWVFIFA